MFRLFKDKMFIPGQRIRQRIPGVGIRWTHSLEIQRNLLMGFDQPLKLALDTNSLKLAISSRDRS